MFALKHLWILTATTAATATCWAQDVGRVISTQPVVQQVVVPHQVCTNSQVEVQQPKSGAGALIGAVAGGASGNQMGSGAGNAAATMIGIVGGAMVGDHIEGTPPTATRTVQNCVTQQVYENKTIGYNVVYLFGGKQYSVQLPYDPGPTIALQITPTGTQVQVPQVVQQQVYVQQTVPVYAQPVYVQPYYRPPVTVNLGIGYWGGGYHRYWR